MAENEGLRVTGEAIVLSLLPDFCKTPPSMAPVPYQILGRFSDSIRYADNVCMTGMNVMTMDSRLTTVYGDEAGVGGGIISGVNMGYCKPITHSPTVSAKGHHIVFHTSLYWMNCDGPDGTGNTIGIVTYVENIACVHIGPLGEIVGDSNPLVEPETSKEKEWYNALWDGITSTASNVVDGAEGLAKNAWSMANDAASTLAQFGETTVEAVNQLAQDAWDAAVDFQLKYKIIERGLGIIGVIDGAKNIIGGVIVSKTVVGAVVGVPAAAYGVDTVIANAKQVWVGEFQATYTEQWLGPEADFVASLITPTGLAKKVAKESLESALKQRTEKALKEGTKEALGEGSENALMKGADDVLEGGPKKGTRESGDNQPTPQKSSNDGVKVNKADFWDESPFERGRLIEDDLANSTYDDWLQTDDLPGYENARNYPVIDFVKGSDVVSLKTADTSLSSWPSKLKSDIRSLAQFDVPSDLVSGAPSKVLDIRVQPGGISTGGQSLQDLVKYGADRGVKVIITEYP